MKNSDLLPVQFQTLLDLITVMCMKIIQNQKDLTSAILHQTGDELEQKLRMHPVPVHHAPDLTAIDDGRYLTDRTLFCKPSNRWRLSSRGKTADTLGTLLNPRFVPPVNLRLLLLRPKGKDQIIPIQLLLNCLGTLFISSLDWLLRSASPTSEILPHGLNRHLHPMQLPDPQLHGIPRSQRKRKLHLNQHLVDRGLAKLQLLIKRKRPVFTQVTAPDSQRWSSGCPPSCSASISCWNNRPDPKVFRQNVMRQTLLPKTNHLPSNLVLCLWTQLSCSHLLVSPLGMVETRRLQAKRGL